MNALQTLNHLRQLLEVSLRTRTMPDFSNWFTRTPVARWLVLNLPWPKGKIKAPISMIDEHLESFETERAQLLGAMQAFVEAHTANPAQIVRSPFLGSIQLAAWAKLQGKHLDHHLRQFGC